MLAEVAWKNGSLDFFTTDCIWEDRTFREEQDRLRAERDAAQTALTQARERADRAEGELEGLKLATEHQHAELAQMRREVAEAHNRAVVAEQQVIEAARQREGAEVVPATARKWNFLNFLFGLEGKRHGTTQAGAGGNPGLVLKSKGTLRWISEQTCCEGSTCVERPASRLGR